LKYDVKITSTGIVSASPIAIWTVNVYACNYAKDDWITTSNPAAPFSYDLRNPPTSSVIATY
jgi:hypothetical protein